MNIPPCSRNIMDKMTPEKSKENYPYPDGLLGLNKPRPTRFVLSISILRTQVFFILSIFVVIFVSLLNTTGHNWPSWSLTRATESEAPLIRTYDLQVGSRWMNQDGGRWRVMLTCNGQSPCPTLYAEEGDMVTLNVRNDLYSQSSIHIYLINNAGVDISPVHSRAGQWNDGVAGVSQYPTLSRGNWTSTHDTTGNLGLHWYIEHTTAGSVDGLYGALYIAPSPSRPRPYHLITSNHLTLREIREAEGRIQHLIIKNHQHRDTGWKMLRMRTEGSEFYCYDSILVNGKGRVHCRHPDYAYIGGQRLDAKGCLQPAGLPDESCKPSTADYEVVHTNGQTYLMLNLMNIGFEHSVMVSVDCHRMVVVANDGGFVEPRETDVVYITNGARVTLLIKLDQEPNDYAIRIASTSHLQNLHSYAILRYPTQRTDQPIIGAPMKLPTESPEAICVHPDGSVSPHCQAATDANLLPPYPASPPPVKSDMTIRLAAGSQPSATEKFVPEFFLNGKPWQLFHASMTPLLLLQSQEEWDALGEPVVRGIPLGAVVDVVVENTLNETVSLYRHGGAVWFLGSGSGSGSGGVVERRGFGYDSVRDAVLAGERGLNVVNPGRVVAFDVPPLEWSVLRYRVDAPMVGYLHAAKLRHFALGMSVPMQEGITPETRLNIPDAAKSRPFIQFEPKGNGIFS